MTDSREDKLVQEICEKYGFGERWDGDLFVCDKQAAAAIRETIEKAREDKWIAVTPETMPEFGKRNSITCICLTEDRKVIPMEWSRNPYASTERGKSPRWKWNQQNSIWKVTHYQPLPSPPEQVG